MKKRYEMPNLNIEWLHENDVLTESQETIFPGDGWVKDPFEET